MAGKPIATVGSMHICPMCSGTVPHVGGPISGPGAPNILANGKPIALIGDMCVCVGPPDVIAQGHPLVKANGVPVVCMGDLTAHGGSVAGGEPNITISTAVPTPPVTLAKEKIPFPKITFFNKAIAAFAGHSLNEAETNIATLAAQTEATPVEETSETVSFTSSFPQDQLQHFATHSTFQTFYTKMLSVFGTDIPSKAYEDLYNDAKNGGTALQPTWLVKKSVPYTGKALFYSTTAQQEIWLDETFITQATTDNDTAGELLAAIVEEYGHWVDYLLRNTYAQTERPDALRDEGAYFAYQLMLLNSMDQKDQHFADATIQGTQHQLLWDYEPLQKSIHSYVNETRWYKDDHFGPFEFYKAGFLKENGDFGHGDIEFSGLKNSFFSSGLLDELLIDEKDLDTIKSYLLGIYFGNWKRDLSQGIDPMFTRLITNTLKAFAIQNDNGKAAGTPQELLERFDIERLKTDTVTENETVNYKFSGLGFTLIDTTFSPVEVSTRIISTCIEMFAVKEFVYNPMEDAGQIDSNINYNQYLQLLKDNFSPVDKAHMGVYIPAEHIDNPIEVGKPLKEGKANDDTAIIPEFIGIDGQNPELHYVNRDFGLKNYIRKSQLALPKTVVPKAFSKPDKVLFSYSYIIDQLKSACKPGGHNSSVCKDHLGAALHTIEDYFAHSNYAEIALIKEGETRVFPWVTKVEQTNNLGLDYMAYIKNPEYKTKVQRNPKAYFVLNQTEGIDYNNNLAAMLPVVTGTFGMLDTMASLLPIVAHFFNYEALKTKKDMAKAKAKAQKETHGSFYFEDNINARNFNDVLALELLRDLTNTNRDEPNEEDSAVVERFLKLLAARDNIYENLDNTSKTAKEIYDKLPQEVKDAYHWLKEKVQPVKDGISHIKDEAIDFILEPIYTLFYNVIIMIASNINDAQVSLASTIETLEAETKNKTWRLNIGMNPTHTQVAKDDPHHPMHTLSAELAIIAVEKVGTAVFNYWMGNDKNFSTVEAQVQNIIKHPAQSKWQSSTVKTWAKDPVNREQLCLASNPSIAIHRLLHINTEIEELIEQLDRVSKQKEFKKINATLKKLYEDTKAEHQKGFESLEDTLKVIKGTISKQNAQLNSIQNAWDTQFPKPWYCQIGGTAPLKTYHYIIKKDDTLYKIAQKANTTVDDIIELNPFLDRELIFPGVDIKLPNPIIEQTNSNMKF